MDLEICKHNLNLVKGNRFRHTKTIYHSTDKLSFKCGVEEQLMTQIDLVGAHEWPEL